MKSHRTNSIVTWSLLGTWSLLALASAFQSSASEFVVDPAQSSIEVEVKATGDDFVAKLGRFNAKISLAESNNLPQAATVTWDFSDLKTGNKSRDKEMLHWLDHEHAPKGSFTLRKCDDVSGQMQAYGELAMHQAKREISFPVEVRREGESITVLGSVKLDHRDFGLPRIVKVLVLRVDPVLNITFSLQGKLVSQSAGTVERR